LSRILDRSPASLLVARVYGCFGVRGCCCAIFYRPNNIAGTLIGMDWQPRDLMRVVFVVLLLALVIASATTRARPRTQRDWMLVWAVLLFLVWALLGFGWLRSR
jgi:hypothetical protein